MPFIPLPNGVKMCFNFQLRGLPVSICVHVENPTSVTQTAVNEIAAVGAAWLDKTSVRAIFSADLAYQTVIATDVSQQPAVQATVVPSTAGGTAANDAIPNNVAVVASLRTGFIGRSYRGRVYLPGIPANVIIDNLITTTWQANIVAAMNALQDDLQAVGRELIVASYQHDLATRETAAGTPVTTFVVNRRIDTQRRRLGRST